MRKHPLVKNMRWTSAPPSFRSDGGIGADLENVPPGSLAIEKYDRIWYDVGKILSARGGCASYDGKKASISK